MHAIDGGACRFAIGNRSRCPPPYWHPQRAPTMPEASAMFIEPRPSTRALQERLQQFFAEHIVPNDAVYAEQVAENRRRGQPFARVPLIAALQLRARAAGLWNLFLPSTEAGGAGLTNLEYAPLC